MMTARTPGRGSTCLIVGVGIAVVGVLVTPVLVGGQGAQRPQVTFTKDIAPILQRSCENCHRAKGVAPMALSTYEDVRPWARAIKQRTALREMPPWFIEKNIGIQEFKDDPSLSDAEIAMIATWVDSGTPRGNPADMPPARQYPDAGAWLIGTPDLIVSSPVVTVKAVAPDWLGDLGVVPTGLTEDRYIKAVQVKETWAQGDKERFARSSTGGFNPFVLHHAIVQAVSQEERAGEERENDEGGRSPSTRGRFQIVFELGQNPLVYPEDAGVLLPAGSALSFPNIHLHAIGKEVPARVDVGFTLHPKGYRPKYTELTGFSVGWMQDELDIPADEDNVRLDGFSTMPQPGRLMTYEPHMHTSGKRFCLEAIYPNGLREMLNCSGYNHNWVKVYTYDDDVAPLLPKGTILHTIGWYDNSAKNPRNVDPRNWKGYGNRTIDDMFIALNRMLFLTEDQFNEQVAARAVKQRRNQTSTAQNNKN